jgi:imidazolonepropionase
MGEIHVIADGALLISNGTIQHVGPTRRVERLAEARLADELDASGRVVMPAFVDCFTQLLCGPPHGRDDADGDPFAATSRAFRLWSGQRMELEGRKRLRQFVRFGTVTVAGSSGYGLDEETEMRSLRALDRLREYSLGLAPILYTTSRAWNPFNGDPWEILENMGTAILPAAHGKRLLSGVAIGDGFPEGAVEGYLACADRLGLTAIVETKGSMVEMACRCRAAVAMDLEAIQYPQARALAESDTVGVLLPGRAFHCGRRPFAPARALIDQGAAIALATGYDNLASPTVSMPMIMALACKQMHMTPEEALTAVTVNAAHALRMGDRLGALQYGMQADLLLMDCSDYREIPLYFGMNPVAMVMRRGEMIFPRVPAAVET